MKKFVLMVGLNDQESKKQEIATEKAINKIVEVLKNNGVEGATLTQVKGLYIHEDGSAVFENTIKIELLFIKLKTVKNIILELKDRCSKKRKNKTRLLGRLSFLILEFAIMHLRSLHIQCLWITKHLDKCFIHETIKMLSITKRISMRYQSKMAKFVLYLVISRL